MIAHLITRIKKDTQSYENKILEHIINSDNQYLIINKDFIYIRADKIIYIYMKNYQFRIISREIVYATLINNKQYCMYICSENIGYDHLFLEEDAVKFMLNQYQDQ
jgi:hypothetical protein